MPEEFTAGIKPYNLNTPLAAVSKERDGEEAERLEERMGGRPATPEEIAGVVVMLCSAEASWSTGGVVGANGGMKFST